MLGDRRDQPPDAPILVGGHLRKVLVTQQLMPRRTELLWITELLVGLATGRIRERLADLLLRHRALHIADGGQHGCSKEPGIEGTVKQFELVVARDERLPKREVDILLAGQVDGRNPAERIGDATRANLEAYLSQNSPERNNVPNDGVSHCCGFSMQLA